MRNDQDAKRRGAALRLLLAGMLLALPTSALALDSALDVSQYAHTAWKVRDGFVKGAINAIAQTPDGYLWLGTEYGLYRFDGVRAVPWQPPAGQQLPSNYIAVLLVARDGALWIGTLKGLASWKDGQLTNYPEMAGQYALWLFQDREQRIWVGTVGPGRLCAVEAGKVQCYGGGSFGNEVSAVYQDRKDVLWVSAETGVWRWKPGPPQIYRLPHAGRARGFAENDRGTLLVATSDGLKQLAAGKIQNYALPGVGLPPVANRLLHSGDGSLWVGTSQGLLHLHQGKTDTFGTADGLSSEVVNSVFDDREGTIWVGTTGGLDRFREFAVPTISRSQGLSTNGSIAIEATKDGAIWITTSNELNRWENGRVAIYGKRSAAAQRGTSGKRQINVSGAVTGAANSGLAGPLYALGLDDQGRLSVSTSSGIFYFDGSHFLRVPNAPGGNIWSIAADSHGKMLVSHGDAGLFYFKPRDAVQPIPWTRFGQKSHGARALLPDPWQGGVWLGFYEGGISYFKDGQVRASYTPADGLGNGRVNQLRFGSRMPRALWAATEGGLSRVKDDHIETLSSKNGLPCDEIHWSVEDDDHAMWVFMPCGLTRIERSEWYAWIDDPRHVIKTTLFDNSDGVPSVGVYGSSGPRVTKAPDGKIWFVQREGVSVIDPRHLPLNKLPPPVHIEQLTADRKTYDAAFHGTGAANGRVRLPPLIRDLQIDYTALSLVAPEKVLFRYKLEGWDRDWQDVGTRRQAFYTNLSPKNYRFRVKACNNSRVWNETGAFLDFTVAPAYYQTTWFRLSCVAALLALLWGWYQLRLQQLAREFNAGLEARVNERTRIARELHDSLLQGFQGLMFRLQALRDMLPGRAPAEAIEALDIALERGDKAIEEGRDTVSDLRQSTLGDNDVPQALTALGEELAAQSNNGDTPRVRVLVEGEQRELNPMLRDEIYRIAREALRNAFRHAKAQKIEAEITYGDSEFLLHVRDDGRGIDPAVGNRGARAGHWGLPGMRERAKRFGGKLEVWSEREVGTEIKLSVPAAIAYGKSDARSRFWFLRRKTEQTDRQQP